MRVPGPGGSSAHESRSTAFPPSQCSCFPCCGGTWFERVRVSMVNANGWDLDMHWRLLEKYTCPAGAPDEEPIWRQAVPIRFGDLDTHALGPTDQLLHVIVHGARWGSDATLRWIADAT